MTACAALQLSATLCNTMKPDETPAIPAVLVAGRPFFSAADVARNLGISRQTLWRWRSAGLVPQGHRHRTGAILFDQAELDAICAYATQLTPLEASRVAKDEHLTSEGEQ